MLRVSLLILVASAAIAAAFLGDSRRARRPILPADPFPTIVEFQDIFEWVRSVELQQTDQAVAVQPRVTMDPAGGWFVIDPQEGQVRLHGRDGSLKTYFGRNGEGPGEFTVLASALRNDSGELVTVDMTGRIARWSADGSRLLDEFRIPVIKTTAAAWVGRDSLLLLALPGFEGGNRPGPVLHLIGMESESVLRSFYEPAVPANARTAWVSFVGGSLSKKGELIGLTLPLLDSLLLLKNVAGVIERMPLGVIGDATRIPDGHAGRAAIMEWARTIKVVGAVSATADGWLIPLLPVGSGSGRVDLIYIPTSASDPVLVRGAPTLLGSDMVAEEVVFDDPDRLEPQYLRIARIRARTNEQAH